MESDDGVLELLDGDGLGVVLINEVEALVDSEVVLAQVVSYLLEDASLPLHSVESF